MLSPRGLARGLCYAAALVCLLAHAAPTRARTFTLEQVLSSPFPSNLVAAERGDRVAWVFRHRGRRNVWVAEAPQWRARQLTRYAEDDGREIADLAFSPDGLKIAYVLGGDKNQAGEVPNPSSDPQGARQEVWVADLRTGASARLGEGDAPFFSHAGDAVLYSRDDKLWSVPVTGGKERKLFEMRGGVSAASWSPDGARLVFASTRGDHSFITIYEPRTSRLRLVEPSVDRDLAPRWSPDGRRIAFVRAFNVTDTFAAERERLQPWAIWVADAATGEGREIWKSGAGALDSFTFAGNDFFRWAANDRIVFASERDGWQHLYSVPAAGGNVILLTPGEYEVENVALTPDRQTIIFSANKDDLNRRHLFAVPAAGGEVRAVTRGGGIEMYPVVLGGGRQIAYLRATARDPLMPYVASIDGANARPLAAEVLPRDFPAAQLVEPEGVTFKAADGLEIHGQLFRPANASGKMPAVVFMHGGPVRQMLLGWHYRGYYHNAYAFNQYLASRGYVVLSVNYRSGIGQGRAFREAPRRGPRGASEYQDVVAAGKYLRSRPDVDGKRIGLWGGSYGGYLTAMGLARDSDLFAAGVDLHGVHDWTQRVGNAPWASGEMARVGRESSPITSVDKWKSPVLLIHGDDDRNVAFSQTVMLVRKLREHDVEFEQLVFPNEVHDFLRHENWLRAFRASAEFFDKHLKGRG